MKRSLPESGRPAATGAVAASLLGLALLAVVLPVAGCARKPATIRITPEKVVLYGLKKNAVLQAEVLDKKGRPLEDAVVGWEVAPPKVATIEKSGRLSSVAPGKARVTARCGETTAAVSVEVVDVASIALAPTRMTLAGPKGTTGHYVAVVTSSTGKPVDLAPKWSVSDPKIASIDASGLVTSLAEGRAGVSAFLGNISASSDLAVVFREVATFELGPATVPLKAGDSARLGVVARDAAGTPIEDVAVDWTSADPKTASVLGGTVKGLAAGSTTVRALCGKHQAEVSVLVY